MKKHIILLLAVLGMISPQLTAQITQRVETVVSADLSEPFGVAVDVGTNAVYITDSVNNRIAKYSDSGGLVTLAGMIGTSGEVDGIGLRACFYSPQGIVFSGGRLVISDTGNHRIRAVTLDGVVTTLAGNTAGRADGTGAAAQFNAPAGLAVDAQGNLYIADVLNNAIRKMTPSGEVTTLIATNLYRPSAVTVGPDGKLFIADSGNNCVKLWENNSLTVFAGHDSRSEYGSVDAPFATDARFCNPKGLLWRADDNSLLVSDTGNGVVRRVFYATNMMTWSVETFAVIGTAGLSKPVGLSVDNTESILLADLGENCIKRLPSSIVTQPAVADPLLGIITLSTNFLSGLISASMMVVTNSTFNNDVVIAILPEAGTEVFYTLGATRNPRAVPDPNSTSPTPPYWAPGVVGSMGDPLEMMLPPLIVDPISPDATVKVIGTASGRKPSSIVIGQFRFQVANPYIDGNNMAAFTITNYTDGAELYYTVDGSEPTTNSTLYADNRISVFNGTTNDVLVKVRGFKEGYHPSSIVSRTFKFDDLKTSAIAITRNYKAGVGSTIVVPVEMKLLSGDQLKSLQFRVEIEPAEATTPALSTNNFRPLMITSNDFIPVTVPGVDDQSAVAQTYSYVNGRITGLAVAFVGTNSLFAMNDSGPVMLLAIQIPVAASPNQNYTLRILEPSGTLDGVQGSVMLSTLVDSKLTLSTDLGYLVGDVANTTWYNAGDFGNTNLNNSDVNVAFYASMGLRLPYSFSDIFDAMDAYPVDTPSSVGGDGQIRYLDWQVTLERSLRLNTNVWRRELTASGRQPVIGTMNNLPASVAESYDNSGLAWFRQARLIATPVEWTSAGQRVSVPVYLNVKTDFNVSGLQFRTLVVPENGAPVLTQQAEFVPASGIPDAPWKLAAAANDVLTGWSLGSFTPPLLSKILLGYVRFTVPQDAAAGHSYAIHFLGVDGAPNIQTQYEFESLAAEVWVESAALRPAETLSDEWKRRFFGSLTHAMSSATADPDGDGIANASEYNQGSNPVNLNIHTSQLLEKGTTADGLKLVWFGEAGKYYRIETSPTLNATPWTLAVEHLLGQGDLMEYRVDSTGDQAQFYRIQAQ